jgi:hypothetical protein
MRSSLQNEDLIRVLRTNFEVSQKSPTKADANFTSSQICTDHPASDTERSLEPTDIAIDAVGCCTDENNLADVDEPSAEVQQAHSSWARDLLFRVHGARRILSEMTGDAHASESVPSTSRSPAVGAASPHAQHLVSPVDSGACAKSLRSAPQPTTPVSSTSDAVTPRSSGRRRTPASCGSAAGSAYRFGSTPAAAGAGARGGRTPPSPLSIRGILSSETYQQVRHRLLGGGRGTATDHPTLSTQPYSSQSSLLAVRCLDLVPASRPRSSHSRGKGGAWPRETAALGRCDGARCRCGSSGGGRRRRPPSGRARCGFALSHTPPLPPSQTREHHDPVVRNRIWTALRGCRVEFKAGMGDVVGVFELACA